MRVLLLADVPGWIVDRCVDHMIAFMPGVEFVKGHYACMTTDEIVARAADCDLIHYGNWDIVTGTSSPGKMQQVQGEVRIDSAAGTMVINGQQTPIDSLDVIEEKGTRHFEWPNGSGTHVLINQFSRQVFLTDSRMYRSMMVQMLVAPPEKFAADFTLVVDRYPWVRAYKVKG